MSLYFKGHPVPTSFGMLIQWPTLPTLLMWPVLVVAYYRLARREEAVLLARFGDAYRQYMAHVPAFVPYRRPWRQPQLEEQHAPTAPHGTSGADTAETCGLTSLK
jgi:hypothetical protein